MRSLSKVVKDKKAIDAVQLYQFFSDFAIEEETGEETDTAEEEAAAAELAELSIPRGFPLTGSASIQDAAAENEEGEEPEEGDGQQQGAAETEPILVFKGTSGNMVVAAATGTVTSVEPDTKYGSKVIIDHGNGYRSIYRNKGDARVKAGDEVVRGSTLFIIGEDNLELGYQIMEGENYINPEDIVEING